MAETAPTDTVLYDDILSVEGYAARLALAFFDVPHRTIAVDEAPGGRDALAALEALPAEADPPVLAIDGAVLWGAPQILAYLAATHDGTGCWSPAAPAATVAAVHGWLAIGVRLTAIVEQARASPEGAPGDETSPEGRRLLRLLDAELWFREQDREAWLAPGPEPSTADIACFAAAALSEEAGLDHEPYPALRRWLDRVKRLPGFTPTPGVFPASPAAPGS